MKYPLNIKILWFFLIFVIFVSTINADDLLNVKTEISNQKYCISEYKNFRIGNNGEIIESSVSSINLVFWLNINLQNISSKKIILQKDFFFTSRTVIAKNIKSYNNEKYISDVNSLILFPPYDFIIDSPPESKFIILQPGESFTKKMESFVDLNNALPKIESGDYYIGKFINIWGGQYNKGIEVKERWKKFGMLWLRPIIIEPTKFNVKIPKLIERCEE